jgi:FMS-like tyrosine kinase 1
MEKPLLASETIYTLMLHCWRLNPDTRPNFAELEEMLDNYLENYVKNIGLAELD